MQTVADIFEAFDGPAAVGRALGVTTEHAAQMKRRRSVPVRYWQTLLAAAADRRIKGIDYAALVRMHAADSAPLERESA